MGFSITPLAQKARTQTIIVDSDLNLGNYDLITTDAKGDTAEFSEFVGGVGNFESGSVKTNLFKYTGNIDVRGAEIIATIPRINGNTVTGATFPNTRITLGVIPFPRYSRLINIEDAIYPETISLTFTLTQSRAIYDSPTVGRIYKDDEEYGTITIPARSGSGSSTINVPYWDNSIWSIGYVSGAQYDNNSIGAYLNSASLYRP